MAVKDAYLRQGSLTEPPRDGEFGVQAELCSQECLAIVERGTRRLVRLLASIRRQLSRYPVSSVGIAIAAGAMLTSLVLEFPLLP